MLTVMVYVMVKTTVPMNLDLQRMTDVHSQKEMILEVLREVDQVERM
jgi:hypothetical protein